MKKFGKFIFGTAVLATLAAGAYYIYKNFIKRDSTDDFDDFEDDFEDFDTEEDSEDDAEDEGESREYVPINLADAKEETSDTDNSNTPSEDNQ